MLNNIFHQPVRTYLMGFIIVNEEVSFLMLKEAFNLSFGNLSTHLSKLENSEYILSHKESVNSKLITTYTPTQKGKEEFHAYLAQMQDLINQVKNA